LTPGKMPRPPEPEPSLLFFVVLVEQELACLYTLAESGGKGGEGQGDRIERIFDF
jgi:hypothetical protein